MSSPDLWLGLLIVAVSINVVLHAVAEARYRALMQKLTTVLDVLVIFADTWGDDVVAVKRELRALLHDRRKTDRTRSTDVPA